MLLLNSDVVVLIITHFFISFLLKYIFFYKATIFAIKTESTGTRVGVEWKNCRNEIGKKYLRESKLIFYPLVNLILGYLSVVKIRFFQTTSTLAPYFSAIATWWKSSISVQCVSFIILVMLLLFLYQVQINYNDADTVNYLNNILSVKIFCKLEIILILLLVDSLYKTSLGR